MSVVGQPIRPWSIADVRHKGHESGPLYRLRNRVLAGRVAARLPTADDTAVAVCQLAKQFEIFIVDIHWARLDAVDVNRVFLGYLFAATTTLRHQFHSV